jgi:hypothetical protein
MWLLEQPTPRRTTTLAKTDLLSPENCAIALIDYQPAMYQGVQSHGRLETFNNVQILAKTAKLFKVPTVAAALAARRRGCAERP